MITVYKYRFPIDGQVEIEMPKGAEVIRVAMQDGAACMWCRVDTEQLTHRRMFYVTGTGHRVPPAVRHVASFEDGSFIWHVWE